MSVDVYYDFVTKRIIQLSFDTYDWILSWCKLDKKSCYNNFIIACNMGDLNGVKKYYNIKYTKDGLFESIKNGHTNIVSYLIDNDKNVELNNCLVLACLSNKIEVIKLLVKKGADINIGIRYAKTINIQTLLFKAKRNEEI